MSADLLCSPRSSSWTSGAPNIAPRPHQTLYKEYRLLETIGKGAFGTVSIAIRRTDGKQLVAKEIALGQASLASAKQREAIMGEVRMAVTAYTAVLDPSALCTVAVFTVYCSAAATAAALACWQFQLCADVHQACCSWLYEPTSRKASEPHATSCACLSLQVNVLARMKHPNIVKYCDCFMDPNYLIIIMEFCSAGDLSGVLKKQTGQLLPEKHIMFLFVQVGLTALCAC